MFFFFSECNFLMEETRKETNNRIFIKSVLLFSTSTWQGLGLSFIMGEYLELQNIIQIKLPSLVEHLNVTRERERDYRN